MRKVLMWAVGVPFLVSGMVLVSFFGGTGEALAQAQAQAHSTSGQGR